MRAKESGTWLSVFSQFTKQNYLILLQYFLLSVITVVLTEVFSRLSIPELIGFITQHPGAFLYNILIIYFSLCISLLFFRRRFWFTLIGGLWIGISIANAILMQYRSMPLTAKDILLMSSVRDIFEIYFTPLALIGLMFFISTLGALIVYIWLNVQKRPWIPIFAIFHAGLLLLVLVSIDRPFTRYDILDERDEFHNIAQAYEDNGFAYCFSASFITGGVKEPEEYSQTEVEEIIEEQELHLPQTGEDTPNIIFIQLESFFDPYYMKDISYPYDPIPNFRSLKETYPHGFLSVPCIGAGTANTEFEVLTGMNLSHFGVGEYPYMTIADSEGATSMATVLSDLGYDTHALHNNNATFYNRHIVYDNLGFSTFTSLEYMSDVTYNPLGWAKDSCLTGEIMKCLSTGTEKKFIYAVSVEPHGRYPKDPVEEPFTIPIQGMEDESRKNGFEYYLYALSQSDVFVGELVEKLSQRSQKTIVVFFGDHLPSFNIQDEELSAGTNQTTEYVIWANYPIQKQVQDLQTYQLGAYIMELAGIYEGSIFRHHQRYGYESTESDIFQEELQTLEYDIVYGEDYAREEEISIPKSPMTLGVVQILLRDVLPGEGGRDFTVRGENFTPFTVVYINDAPCATVYVSPNVLLVKEELPSSGDMVKVVQVSAVDPFTVLSESSPLVIATDLYKFSSFLSKNALTLSRKSDKVINIQKA